MVLNIGNYDKEATLQNKKVKKIVNSRNVVPCINTTEGINKKKNWSNQIVYTIEEISEKSIKIVNTVESHTWTTYNLKRLSNILLIKP